MTLLAPAAPEMPPPPAERHVQFTDTPEPLPAHSTTEFPDAFAAWMHEHATQPVEVIPGTDPASAESIKNMVRRDEIATYEHDVEQVALNDKPKLI
jgi:hypothetical protein